MLSQIRHQPVQRMLLLGLGIVAIFPLLVLGARLYDAAWDNAWREITEKHQLLALNLASPISIYINDHRESLSLLASRISADSENNQSLLNETSRHIQGYTNISLVDIAGKTLAQAGQLQQHHNIASLTSYQNEKCYLLSRANGTSQLSGIKRSPLTQEPTIVISEPVFDEGGNIMAVLMAELDIALIESLRANIRFGINGHSAIVDASGKVVAHPNPNWMAEIKDLSHLDVIKNMMAGKTGVTEFYSPFVKDDMVAGYTSVPDIGWGIMVPQPKQEVANQVNTLLTSYSVWGLSGLFIATIIGLLFSKWITTPINRIAQAAIKITKESDKHQIPEPDKWAPLEVKQLSFVINDMVQGLQESSRVNRELNASLQKQVNEATDELRRSNTQLIKLAQSDHLTLLSNRRYFEDSMQNYLKENTGEVISIILIDVDNFKDINDKFGHNAGDLALKEIARLLNASTRYGDVVARYGGDEFVARFNCDEHAAQRRAEELRRAVHEHTIIWQDKRIKTTISVGVLTWTLRMNEDFDQIMHAADSAMYQAKQAGRNQVSVLKDAM